MKPLTFITFSACFLFTTILAQRPLKPVRFKNGDLNGNINLLKERLGGPQWQNIRYQNKYYSLIRFESIPQPFEKNELSALGIRLFDYIPENAFMAEIADTAAINKLANLHVIALYAVPSNLKLIGELKTYTGQDLGDINTAIAVGFYGNIDKMEVIRELQASGAKVITTKIQFSRIIFIKGSSLAVKKIAALPFISFISRQELHDIPLNYNNRAIHALDALSSSSGRNLQGENVTIGVGDDGDPSSHIDFAGRLTQRNPEPYSSHGTHTTGTTAGGGIINPKYKGMAPRANLISQYFSDILVNAPTYMHDYNMVLTSNSYYSGLNNCPGEGEYDPLSNYVDSQLNTNPTLLHAFAAGNDGAITCSPYPADFATIKSGFQCGKDILTVGAIDNSTYAIKVGSSRGPVNDGRIKPEIMAGGENIYSTFPHNNYGYLSGTSMASPTVTGTLALLYERYKQLHAGSNPSGALIKAIACNSADDLGNPGPDFTYGFGMLNARTAVETIEGNQYFSGTMDNSGSTNFTITGLPAGVMQLKIMLYWPDPAATPYTAATLINDLDLTVSAPDGTIHHPLILDPSPAGVMGNAVEGTDSVNNIEQVVINNPVSGNFTINVSGSHVPLGPQAFVIAYQIINPSVTVEYPYGNETWVPGESENIRWSCYGGGSNNFTIEYSPDQGTTWNLISNAVPSTSRLFAWTVPATATNTALIRVSCNSTTLSSTSHYNFSILGQPTIVLTNPCPGYAQLVWNTIPFATGYEIMRLAGDSMLTIANTTDTNYIVSGLNRDSSYWFSVRADNNAFAGRRAIASTITPSAGPCTLAQFINDFTIDSVILPVTGRAFTSTQLSSSTNIQVELKNLGTASSSSPYTLSYQVNNGTIITENSSTVIPGQTASNYSFSTPFDFSAPGSYSIKVWVNYPGDSSHANDSLSVIVSELQNDTISLNPAYTEGFETSADVTYINKTFGFSGLDRFDFNNSNANGRVRTFINTGFARTGNRSATLDQITNSPASTADSLIATFNLSNYSSTNQIWLDFYYNNRGIDFSLPGNQVWIRGNDQAAWIPVDTLSIQPADIGIYKASKNIDVTGILASAIPSQSISSSFQVKFGEQGFTSTNSVVPDGNIDDGYSFDDITLTKSSNDVGLKFLLLPTLTNFCQLSNAETISVEVKNYSPDTLTNIPISYAINGVIVTETIALIAPFQTIAYVFTHPADLSAFQQYNLGLWVSYPSDNYQKNDSLLNIIFQTTPLISSYPYLEGFENNNGYWYTQGVNDSWQWGTPEKTIINKAANGSKIWVTSLTGNYNDNELSYLYSPCFDLTSLAKPVLSFSHIFQTEDDCDCDYHWVEYSTDDANWVKLGAIDSGTNWYDNVIREAWQKSYPKWHVSSYVIPVNPAKIRFRIVMASDQATNYEGVGIDDVHVFDNAPVYIGPNIDNGLTQAISGNSWIDFEVNGTRVASINPNGQDLGNTAVKVFINKSGIRNSDNQYYLDRNIVIQPTNQPSSPVSVRFYFLDSEADSLINATGCNTCTSISDAYESGITQYSHAPAQEDSTLNNNISGTDQFILPRQQVSIIPQANGYYAEYQVNGFSEFWINGGGPNQNQPLPLILQSFTATKVNQTGLLQWTVSPGTSIDSFIIQKSTDGTNFAGIGSVEASSSSGNASQYQFTDNNLVKGTNYYRLMIIDSSGDFQYSIVRSIIFSLDDLGIIVYPNPVSSGTLYINTPINCNRIDVYDASGRLIKSVSVSGLQNSFYTGDLARGVYLMRISLDSGTGLQKIIVD
jgi:Subtilase family/Secretion system C-terminal sorting domain